ncbi:MAG: ribbon-helix-helix domain-containing protein [Bryobacteraceae bacterium]
MATTKITITLPDAQLEEIRRRVEGNEASSVSGFVQLAVQRLLESDVAFRALVDEALEASGGPLTAKERAWAKKVLTPRKRGAKPGQAA